MTSIDTTAANMERLFPTLTPAQVARFETFGRRRSLSQDQVLVDPGDRSVPFFVVLSGAVDVVRVSGESETRIVTHFAGQFTGEAAMIAGRRSLVRVRVSEPGDVLQLTRDQLLALIQSDVELSEILMRAFILRRLELIARDLGDVVVLGSMHTAGTLRRASS